ncbi:nicotinate-nucleotide--dimethylbenzimidazole phosphoribosyltransferase [Alcanivorax sp. S71-1-4]|uniref:nicotinate-nucleotide--dimethylbenzimidazole phosphoribosyltransferase n=1 Tax=Alcanivorax sp. S71-1-4 TaxID=1177159 RepID=UPI001F1DDC73|nr:nicotinate-nucleotide--dimethylbenzimidazole phosphoribosyltransferase [Alcanivorax sp. S71-1-4]
MNEAPIWRLTPPDINTAMAARARARQAMLTKPPGSLGRLERLAITLSAQQHREQPDVDAVRIVIFAGDHGVCAENISAFPQVVTAQMVANFAAGGAAISVLARHLGADLEVINTGTVTAQPRLPGVLDERLGAGTANIVQAPAMTQAQCDAALDIGVRAAARAAQAGIGLFVGGEMGIGNTTSATAVASALLGSDPAALTGPGTGLAPAGVAHKVDVIRRALQRHGQDTDPLHVLTSLGGFEINALTGALLGCAQHRIPVLVDGFIVSVAALAACRLQPALRDWLHFAHRSSEPGHSAVLGALDADPLLELDMRLGEGSGAAVAVPLLQAACRLHNQMASFDSAGVSHDS